MQWSHAFQPAFYCCLKSQILNIHGSWQWSVTSWLQLLLFWEGIVSITKSGVSDGQWRFLSGQPYEGAPSTGLSLKYPRMTLWEICHLLKKPQDFCYFLNKYLKVTTSDFSYHAVRPNHTDHPDCLNQTIEIIQTTQTIQTIQTTCLCGLDSQKGMLVCVVWVI